MNDSLVLLTGATGYVGGRLLNKLEALGVTTRCLARRPEYLHAESAQMWKSWPAT